MNRKEGYASEIYLREFGIGDMAGVLKGAGKATMTGIGLLNQITYPAMIASSILGPVISKISDIYNRGKWESQGCESIEDPDEQQKCRTHNTLNTINLLKGQYSSCEGSQNPDRCKAAIDAKIAQVTDDAKRVLSYSNGNTSS